MDPSFERAGKRSGARRSVPRSEERRDLDLHTSVLSPLTSVPLGYPRTLPPAKRNWRDAVVLASRSDTGLRKQTGYSRPLLVFLPLSSHPLPLFHSVTHVTAREAELARRSRTGIAK